MKDKKKPVLFMLILSAFILLIILLMQPAEIIYLLKTGFEIAMLDPKGIIALKERNLLFFIQVVMLFVIIPVYIFTFIFSWKYRAHNTKATYTPDWDDSRLAEYLWWGIPCFFTLIIVVITWIETHRLDPFKPLKSDKPTQVIQVVALQWKWLFIYPEEGIATVNFVQFPEKTPVRFEITADAPMNSFWIPQLGGQIYAMPKMKTLLHLIADTAGEFRGSSANLSGKGFSDMHFMAKASSDEEFHQWINSVKSTSTQLDYQQLALPSENNPVETFMLKDKELFNEIIMKYMHPAK